MRGGASQIFIGVVGFAIGVLKYISQILFVSGGRFSSAPSTELNGTSPVQNELGLSRLGKRGLDDVGRLLTSMTSPWTSVWLRITPSL